MDPRSIDVDGGVFSRSITIPSYTPRPGVLPGTSSLIQSKCSEQHQQLHVNMLDNKLRNFGTTYLSDNFPREATATSLDGSRRR